MWQPGKRAFIKAGDCFPIHISNSLSLMAADGNIFQGLQPPCSCILIGFGFGAGDLPNGSWVSAWLEPVLIFLW